MNCHIFVGQDYDTAIIKLDAEGSIHVPQPLDDTTSELEEGYLFTLSINTSNIHQLDRERVQVLNRFVLVTIKDDDSKPNYYIMY